MTATATLIAIALIALSADGPPPELSPAAKPAQPALAEASLGCDRYAAPNGSDRLDGSRRRPYRSVPRLLRSLRAGETACLMPGRYRHGDPALLRRPGARIVGIDGRAQVDGAIWITPGAAGSEIRGLQLTATDSTYFIPIKVQANRARIAGNRIRGSRSTTCVLVGSTRRVSGVRIEGNWIHRCGRTGKLDHLIYVQQSVNAVVRGNVLSDNRGGWGVHLFPDADHTVIEGNLIDGNLGGVIFGGEGSQASDSNVVRANAITNSGPRWNLEGSWDERPGEGNVAYGNCLYSTGPDAPAGIGAEIGFVTGPSAIAMKSPYALRTTTAYRFRAAQPCAALVEPLPSAFPETVP